MQAQVWVWTFRTRSSDAWGQKADALAQAERVNLPFFCLFVLFRPSVDRVVPPTLLRVIFLTQSLIQMLISSPNTLANTPRNNALSTIWASFSFIKLTYKINHYITSMRKVNKWMKSVMGMSEGKGINIFSVRWPVCAKLDKCQESVAIWRLYMYVYSIFTYILYMYNIHTYYTCM